MAIFDERQDSGIPQEAVNIALERIKRIFDMVEYEQEYDDQDEGVDYGDSTDFEKLEQIFAPEPELLSEIETLLANQGYNTSAPAEEMQSYAEEQYYEEPYTVEQYAEEEPYVEPQAEAYAEKQEAQPIAVGYVRATARAQSDMERHSNDAELPDMNEPVTSQRIYANVVAVEAAPAPAPAPVPTPATVAAKPIAAKPAPAQSEEEDVARLVASYNRKRSAKYRKILSLYVDNPTQEQQQPSQPQQQQITKEQIVEKAMERLVTVDNKVDVSALLPDAFKELNDDGIELLTNDLFGGNTKNFVATLLTIDEQPNLEEAIFYIAENFVWDGDSDAAKLLFTLLQRRFA